MRTTFTALAGAAALTVTLAACGNGAKNDGAGPSVVASSATSTSATSAAPSTPPSSSTSSKSASGSASSSNTAASSAAPTSASASASASHSNSTTGRGTATASSGGSTSTGGSASAPKASSASAAPGGSSYTATGWSQFTTPTGKNWCDMTQGDVGCTLTPALSAKHGGAGYVMLTAKGVTYITGDPGWDTDGTAAAWTRSVPGAATTKQNGTAVLPYGSSISFHATKCTSSSNGITCSNGVAGFTVNSTSVTTSGKQAPAQ